MTKLPADIEVLEPIAGAFRETHFRLPARTHESVRRNFRHAVYGSIALASIPCVFSIVVAVQHEDGWLMPILFFGSFLFPLAGIILLAAILQRWTRREIICTPGRLTLRSRFGPFRWTRRLPLAQLKGFRVQTGTLRVEGITGSTPFDPQAKIRNVGSLFADYERGHARMICSGYDPGWLKTLAEELTDRCAAILGKAGPLLPVTSTNEDPAIIERRSAQPSNSDARLQSSGDTFVITHPPRGWRYALPRPFIASFLGWNGVLIYYTVALCAGQVGWANNPGKVPIWLGLLLGSPFYVISICCLATWYAYAHYTARWEISGQELRFWHRQLFGAGTEVWQRKDLQAIRVVSTKADSDQDTWSTRLQITATGKPLKELMRDRDKSELEWLATVLSKEFGLAEYGSSEK